MSSVLKVDAIQNTAGTSALTIDSGGRILKPTTPHFHVTKTDGHVGANATIVWNNKVRDTETAYNTSTGQYTIPSGLTGLWWFGICGMSYNTGYIELSIQVNSTITFSARNESANNAKSCAIMTVGYYATAGDVLSIHTQGSSSMYGTGSPYAYWTGYFIG